MAKVWRNFGEQENGFIPGKIWTNNRKWLPGVRKNFSSNLKI